MVDGPEYDDQDLEETSDYDDGYDDGDDELGVAELNVLNCIIQLSELLIKDITEDRNAGVLAYGGLALKRHSEILVHLIEDRIMADMIKESEEDEDH